MLSNFQPRTCDNESGRGLLRSGVVGGTNFLIVAGARADDQDYIYMTTDSGSGAHDFLYVDLSSVLGGQTTGVTAAFAAFDRLYIGLPDTGGNQPAQRSRLPPNHFYVQARSIAKRNYPMFFWGIHCWTS